MNLVHHSLPVRIAAVTGAGAVAAGIVLFVSAAVPHAGTSPASPNLSCSSPSPCLVWTNTGSGDAIKGTAANNNGLAGWTKFNGSTQSNFRSGVYGVDASTSGTFNNGISGQSTNGQGGLFRSVGGNGIIATSTSGEGIGTLSTNGIGGRFIGPNFVGVDAEGGFNQGDGTIYPALSVVGESSTFTAPDLIDACPVGVGDPCQQLFSVLALDQSGNLTIAGQIFTSGSCSSGCLRPGGGGGGGGEHRVVSYAPRESSPTMEDFGEAQLVRGQAYVTLQRDFANVIDRGASYLVFITPEGDNRGLYVTGKTAAGFSVRESQGGASTIAFQYRIVAKPYGTTSPRLPMVRTRVGMPRNIANSLQLRH